MERVCDQAPLLDAIVAAVPQPFFVLDREGRYLAVLGGRHNTLYHDGETLVGKRMHDVMAAELADPFLAKVHEALDSGQVVTLRYELGVDDIEGVHDCPPAPRRLWFDAYISPVVGVDNQADSVVWMPYNITDLKDALDELETQRAELDRLANLDALTGIRNRRAFFEAANRELAACRRSNRDATLLLADLDHFKGVNDAGGHAAGDAVLVVVAELLNGDRRESDLVARLGGEEFVVLLTDTDLAAGEIVAERVRATIAGLAVPSDGRTFTLTASVGVAPVRPDDRDIADVLRRADDALYDAKRQGRNRVAVHRGGVAPVR